MTKTNLQIDDRAIITQINGSPELKSYLLYNGISIGSIIYKNYSPRYAKLVSITINGKMISLRVEDFEKLEWVIL